MVPHFLQDFDHLRNSEEAVHVVEDLRLISWEEWGQRAIGRAPSSLKLACSTGFVWPSFQFHPPGLNNKQFVNVKANSTLQR